MNILIVLPPFLFLQFFTTGLRAKLSDSLNTPPDVRIVFVTPTPVPTITPTPTPTPIPTTTPTPHPTPTPKPTPIPVTSQELDAWFSQYSHHYSIDRQLLWQIAVCESKLNPSATNGPYAGMYQFLEGTWRSTRAKMNADANPQLRLNPEEAIKTAAFRISILGSAAWPSCGK